MVSLKFVNSQRALAERQQRIQGARVVGSQLGQENARRYRKAKEEQDVVVREELKNRFERLRDERLAEMENAWKGAREGVLTAAEAATAYEQSLAQRGHEEIAAWEAERQLEHQRHVIAVEKERTLREQHAIRVKATAARRERVRQLEAARSARVVQQSASSRSMLERINESMRTNTKAPDPSISVQVQLHHPAVDASAPSAADATGISLAQAHEMESRERQREKERKLEETHRYSTQRAAMVIQSKRQKEEQLRAEQAEQAQLKQRMMENAYKSSKHILHSDFQEQEARAAQRLHRLATAEFESVFLSGKWSAEEIRRLHQPPASVMHTLEDLSTITPPSSGSAPAAPPLRLRATPFTSRVISTATAEGTSTSDEAPVPAADVPVPHPLIQAGPAPEVASAPTQTETETTPPSSQDVPSSEAANEAEQLPAQVAQLGTDGQAREAALDDEISDTDSSANEEELRPTTEEMRRGDQLVRQAVQQPIVAPSISTLNDSSRREVEAANRTTSDSITDLSSSTEESPSTTMSDAIMGRIKSNVEPSGHNTLRNENERLLADLAALQEKLARAAASFSSDPSS